MQGEKGLIEFLSIGDYGKEQNIKANFLGIDREINGVPNQNYDPVYMGLNGGFSGYLSQVQYFAYALGANKIQSIIAAGPNLRTLDGNLNNTDANYLSFRWFFPLQSSEMQ